MQSFQLQSEKTPRGREGGLSYSADSAQTERRSYPGANAAYTMFPRLVFGSPAARGQARRGPDVQALIYKWLITNVLQFNREKKSYKKTP